MKTEESTQDDRGEEGLPPFLCIGGDADGRGVPATKCPPKHRVTTSDGSWGDGSGHGRIIYLVQDEKDQVAVNSIDGDSVGELDQKQKAVVCRIRNWHGALLGWKNGADLLGTP